MNVKITRSSARTYVRWPLRIIRGLEHGEGWLHGTFGGKDWINVWVWPVQSMKPCGLHQNMGDFLVPEQPDVTLRLYAKDIDGVVWTRPGFNKIPQSRWKYPGKCARRGHGSILWSWDVKIHLEHTSVAIIAPGIAKHFNQYRQGVTSCAILMHLNASALHAYKRVPSLFPVRNIRPSIRTLCLRLTRCFGRTTYYMVHIALHCPIRFCKWHKNQSGTNVSELGLVSPQDTRYMTSTYEGSVTGGCQEARWAVTKEVFLSLKLDLSRVLLVPNY